MAKQVVQGDVLFVWVSGTVADFTPAKNFGKTVAVGEKTGHAHVIEGDGYVGELLDGRRVVVANEALAVRHEEHGLAPLEKGVHEVRLQQVFDYPRAYQEELREARRRVVD